MNKFLILALIISGALRLEAAEWKVAESDSCGEKLTVTAKEGESFVTIQKGEEKIKLLGKNGEIFHEESMSQTEFSSFSDKVKYTLILPGVVDGNPPKLDLVQESKIKRCRLELSR